MKISIFGLGYVGAVSMACLARDGHEVVGVDLDPLKLELIRQGRSPIVEEGIQELTAQVMASGRVRVTDDVAEAVQRHETVVHLRRYALEPERQPGPVGRAARGGTDRRGVEAQGRLSRRSSCARPIQPGAMDLVVKAGLESTSGKKANRDFGLCFQPEFLREGTSIKDYDNPPFTVIGTEDERAAAGAARGVRTLAMRIPDDVDRRGRDAQVRLQRVPCGQDHLRQRDRATVAVRRRRCAASHGPRLQGHSA